MYESNVANYKLTRCSHFDLYELGSTMSVLVHTDRYNGGEISGRGKLIHLLNKFWQDKIGFQYNVISFDANQLPKEFHSKEFRDRSCLIERSKQFEFSVHVYGYLMGELYDLYKVGYINAYPDCLRLNQHLPTPMVLFKNKDKLLTFEDVADEITSDIPVEIEALSAEYYLAANKFSWYNSLVIPATVFDWGYCTHTDNWYYLVNDIFSIDNTSFWNLESYEMDREIFPLDPYDDIYLKLTGERFENV